MDKLSQEAANAVDTINLALPDDTELQQMLKFEYNYFECSIIYLGEPIWNSEWDERRHIDDAVGDGCTQEPFVPYLINRMADIHKDLNQNLVELKENIHSARN